jgi:hypothetical protein
VLAFKNWGQIHNNKPGYKFGNEDVFAELVTATTQRSPGCVLGQPRFGGWPYGRVGGAIASRAIAILKKDPARSGASTNGAGDGLAPPRPDGFGPGDDP